MVATTKASRFDVSLARPSILRVTSGPGDLWIVEWRDADGTPYCGLYRETCVEIWRGRPDETHRQSVWGRDYFDTLKFAWDLSSDAIEQLTKLEIEEMPPELLEVLVEIAFDGERYWSRAARAAEVRL